jgi:hypothetical protein
MTDLDTLRRALQTRQDLGPDGRATPDLREVMARGRRLRLRRRLTVAGGAVCAAAVVFGVVSGSGQLTRSAPVPGQGPAGPTRIVHPPSPRHTHVSTPVPVPSPTGPVVARPSAVPIKGASISTPVPTPSKAAGSAPVATTGNGTGSTSVPTPSQSQLAMLIAPFGQGVRSGAVASAVTVSPAP